MGKEAFDVIVFLWRHDPQRSLAGSRHFLARLSSEGGNRKCSDEVVCRLIGVQA